MFNTSISGTARESLCVQTLNGMLQQSVIGIEDKLCFCDEVEKRLNCFGAIPELSPSALKDIFSSFFLAKIFSVEEYISLAGLPVDSSTDIADLRMGLWAPDLHIRRLIVMEMLDIARKHLSGSVVKH